MYYFLFVALYGTVRTNAIYFPKEDRKKEEVIPTRGGVCGKMAIEVKNIHKMMRNTIVVEGCSCVGALLHSIATRKYFKKLLY